MRGLLPPSFALTISLVFISVSFSKKRRFIIKQKRGGALPTMRERCSIVDSTHHTLPRRWHKSRIEGWVMGSIVGPITLPEADDAVWKEHTTRRHSECINLQLSPLHFLRA